MGQMTPPMVSKHWRK